MPSELARTLDEIAAQAMPALLVQDVDGWVARYSPGLATKRVNSVWPHEDGRSRTLEAKLATVERFYAVRGLPARFEVSPAAQPTGLDGSLERRGYQESGRTSVEVCDLADLASELPRRRRIHVDIDSRPTGRWLSTWQAALALSDASVAAATGLFDRVTGPVAFAAVGVDGRPAGVALGVLDGEWLGIFNMATGRTYQRRGVGRAALGALAGWARQRGARAGYLQVDLDNGAAARLYRAVGFESAYRYAYRTLPRTR